MVDILKLIFHRELADEEEGADETKKRGGDFHATGGFNPSDSNYDPQTRLKRRLKLLFPHMPELPGLPPRTAD